MQRPSTILLAACAFTLCLSASAAVRGERSGGIGADLAVDEALRSFEAQNAHKLQLSSDLLALQQRELALRAPMRDHVRALYRVTRGGTAPVAGGFDAMRSYLSRVRRLKTIVLTDIQRVAQLHNEQRSARAEEQQAERDLVAAQTQLDKLRSEAGAVPPRAAQTALAPKPSERAADTGDREFYGLRLSEGTSVAPFEALRGKLAAPVSGELRLREVQRGDSKLLLFEAPAGATVRASAAGRVSWSDAHSVVVDHGGGYQTAYGQLGNVEVHTGDEVSVLARLGSVADASEPALLFEIRKGSRSFPARPWLGL
jgi:murein DD-endopeptidase MepM/ murein hydrolase activator NlpD